MRRLEFPAAAVVRAVLLGLGTIPEKGVAAIAELDDLLGNLLLRVERIVALGRLGAHDIIVTFRERATPTTRQTGTRGRERR